MGLLTRYAVRRRLTGVTGKRGCYSPCPRHVERSALDGDTIKHFVGTRLDSQAGLTADSEQKGCVEFVSARYNECRNSVETFSVTLL
jgi:hypothetical protein